jgi:hypothetical protein
VTHEKVKGATFDFGTKFFYGAFNSNIIMLKFQELSNLIMRKLSKLWMDRSYFILKNRRKSEFSLKNISTNIFLYLSYNCEIFIYMDRLFHLYFEK